MRRRTGSNAWKRPFGSVNSCSKSARIPRKAAAKRRKHGPRRPIPKRRKMKFADGGTRPGFNVHFDRHGQRRDRGRRGNNLGSDQGELPPMLEQVRERSGKTPDEALVDGGFAALEAIDEAAERGCTVYGDR